MDWRFSLNIGEVVLNRGNRSIDKRHAEFSYETILGAANGIYGFAERASCFIRCDR